MRKASTSTISWSKCPGTISTKVFKTIFSASEYLTYKSIRGKMISKFDAYFL